MTKLICLLQHLGKSLQLTIHLQVFSDVTLGTDGADHIEFFFEIKNGANDSLDVAQFQLERGSVATDFEVRPIAEELALCQRYFQLAGSGSIGRCKNTTEVQGIGGQWKVVQQKNCTNSYII